MRTDECEYAKGDHEAPSKDNADDGGVGTGVYYCVNRISKKLHAWDVRAGPKKIEKQRGHSDEEHCHDERRDADAEPPSGSSSGAEPIDTAEASGLKRFGGRPMRTGGARSQVAKVVQRHVLLVGQVQRCTVSRFESLGLVRR